MYKTIKENTLYFFYSKSISKYIILHWNLFRMPCILKTSYYTYSDFEEIYVISKFYCNHHKKHTWKKALVLPEDRIPYWISVCLARSSADSIGVNIRSTVRKAAKLAVYDDMIIRVKNHQTLPTILPETDLKCTNYVILQARAKHFRLFLRKLS